ncbi:TetR/AcrR family transcriptional regulator [Paenibacillus flagellatus]|uniref:TetR/AcrR family transcriptional regulator n=1 Tax=Paenibacillus flagellatus TaxID=2211139 RepID=A0A2V5KMI4_9BACL|nr:TetR/AcrR family transcriptional regulator [Paenibacillus flagellatus]PYI56380.1 TetR/AcrR family transcriptional regulator [Paenibacillus flagellatus]
MGRPSKGEAKKALIVQTALKLFSRNGYSATTTKQIAEACGVAEGLLFYYFGSKEELMRTVVRTFSFAELARGHGEEWRALTGKEALIRFATLYLSFLERHRDYLALIWSPELIRDERATGEVTSLIRGMVEEGGRLVARAASADGGGPQPSVHTVETGVSMLLSSLLAYFAIQGRSGERTPEADDAYVREAVDIVWSGVFR